MNDGQRKSYEENLECDFSFAIPNLARFRVNAFVQHRGAGAVFRTIPSKILSLDDLKAPKIFAEHRRPAARPGAGHRPDRLGQVDHARRDGQPHQRERARPHPHHRGPDRVRARVEEVPDQPARGRAAHAVVRQRAAQRAARGPGRDPGRRDARPGDHPPRADRAPRPATWCSARCTRRSAAKTIDRIVDVFPAAEKEMVRAMLSESLRAVISQTLLQDQGRHRPRRGARDHDRHAGDPQPDPRGQDRADVLGDPDRPAASACRRSTRTCRSWCSATSSRCAEARGKAANKDNFAGRKLGRHAWNANRQPNSCTTCCARWSRRRARTSSSPRASRRRSRSTAR